MTRTVDSSSREFPSRLTSSSFINIESVRDPGSDHPHKIPSKLDFLQHLKTHDVRPTDDIIFYDDFSVIGASRARFLFGHFGISSAVANFRTEDWLREGQCMERDGQSFQKQVG